MPRGDAETATLWLTVPEFARLVMRPKKTMYDWIRNGTLLEFGYITRHDIFGRPLVGVPPQHSSYIEFMSAR